MAVPHRVVLLKALDEKLTRDSFAEDLSRLFREAHASTRECLGVNQRRQKDPYHKKFYGKPYGKQDKVWVYSKHEAKYWKFFLTWEGPFVVSEQTSEVDYKVAKPNQIAKGRILHYNMLKPYLEEGDVWNPKEGEEANYGSQIRRFSGKSKRRSRNPMYARHISMPGCDALYRKGD